MEELIRDVVGSDSSEYVQKKTIREERKVKTKKKKRKRDLVELHQKVLKAKKVLDRRTTGTDGKSGKARGSKKICNRLLPRPLAGIYRNGATGKEIRRNKTKLTLTDFNNARLQGDMFKLLNGYESKSENAVDDKLENDVSKKSAFNSPQKNIFLSSSNSYRDTPILGKMNGETEPSQSNCLENYVPLKNADTRENNVTKQKSSNVDSFRGSPITRYEELCNVICLENFQEQDFPEDCTSDPLSTVKKKLRNVYADTFRNQFLRDMIRHGTVLNERENPLPLPENIFSPTEVESYTSHCSKETELLPGSNESVSHAQFGRDTNNDSGRIKTSDLISSLNTKFDSQRCSKNDTPATDVLFNYPLLTFSEVHKKIRNVEPREPKKVNNTHVESNVSTEKHNYISHEVNSSAVDTTLKVNNSNRSEDFLSRCFNDNELVNNNMVSSRTQCFVVPEVELPRNIFNNRSLKKRKDRCTQTIAYSNNTIKKHFGKVNFKSSQRGKGKVSKHVPAILRRCNNNTYVDKKNCTSIVGKSIQFPKESWNLFQVSPKQNVLFTQRSLMSELEDPKRVSSNVDTKKLKMKFSNIEPQATTSSDNNGICFLPQATSMPRTQDVDIFNDILIERRQINDSTHPRIMARPSVQKTMVFTKKDSHNIHRCLHTSNVQNDEPRNDSDVCQTEKKFYNHGMYRNNCQQISGNYCRMKCCLQNSNNSNLGNRESQESNHYRELLCDEASHGHPHHASQLSNVQVQKSTISDKMLYKKRMPHLKLGNNRNHCHNMDECVRFIVVDPCNNICDERRSQSFPNDLSSKMKECQALQNRHLFCQEEVPDGGILNGVQKLQILSVDEGESQRNFKHNDERCIGNTVILDESHHPIKYLAFENNLGTQRLPIYAYNDDHVDYADNLNLINSKTNCHGGSYSRESLQKVMVVPSYEENDIVYLKPRNLKESNVEFDGCSHSRKVILCQQKCPPAGRCVTDPTNVYEIQVSNANAMGRRNLDGDGNAYDLQNVGNMRKSRRSAVNWEDVQCRANYEHAIASDACTKNQTVFCRK